jgi:serine protease Do
MRRRFLAFGFVLAAVLSAALAPVAWAETKAVPASRAEVTLSFAPVVKKVAPAVVNIYAKRMVAARPISPLFNDPFFRRFFGDSFGGFGQPRERAQNSLGSGVIVARDGLVVTNHHVIAGASEITVVLADRREFPAEIVVDDERTDLTVLRIDAAEEALPFVELKDSDQAEVGDLVLAIGNPFGVGQTVTSGIVSARARTQVGINDFSFFIQTDAAINPGNSGGALVTLDGKLLGINTAIYSKSGGSVGIGFAVPANMVRTVIASARNGGRVVRPWIGLTGQTVDADLAEAVGLLRPGGVIVAQVYKNGPADQAGARKGDVIVSVDGEPVFDVESFRFRVATGELGERAEVEIWRDRAAQTLVLPLIQAPEDPPRNETLLLERHPLAGATVANLSPALAEEIDRPGAWEGVIVTEVGRGSVAGRLRFRAGDVILAVNGRELRRVGELIALLKDPSDHWSITFSRAGRVRTVEFSS